MLAKWLYFRIGVTPNQLSYFRVFASIPVAFLIIAVIQKPQIALIVAAILLDLIAVYTDKLDGILARYLDDSKIQTKKGALAGAVLDRICDKIHITMRLLPIAYKYYFFSLFIVTGEALLAYQALNSKTSRKSATLVGKVKMSLESAIAPVFLLDLYFQTAVLSAIIFCIFSLAILFLVLSILDHQTK